MSASFPEEQDEVRPVGKVVLRAREVIVYEAKPETPPDVVRRYQINALLAALLVGIAGYWYVRHAKTYFSEAVVVGLPAMWALWQIFRSAFIRDLGDEMTAARKKLLARPGITENLLFAIVAALLITAMTGSITMSLGDGPVTEATLAVVDVNGSAVMDDVKLSTTDRVATKLFMPSFGRKNLRVVVKDPPGYVPKRDVPVAFGANSALVVDFAKHFQKKKLHVLRIVPDHVLHHALANAGDGVLTISTPRGAPIRLEGYLYRSVCLGVADRETLQAIYDSKNDQRFQDELEQRLLSGGISADRAKVLASGLRKPIFVGDRDLTQGDRVRVRLTASTIKPVNTTFIVGEAEMATHFLSAELLPIPDVDAEEP